MKEVVGIMNKEYKISLLEEVSEDAVVKSMLEEYNKDRNCSAYDWICGENITELQKAAFIYSVNFKVEVKLSDIRTPFRKNIQRNMYIGQLRDFKVESGNFTNKYGYVLDFDVFLPSKGKNLQRPFVWTLEQKRELIMSILKDVEIPPCTVLIREMVKDKKVFLIIDGKQRLSTMISFVSDGFSINLLGKEYLFSELPKGQSYKDSIRHTILSYSIHFNQAYDYWDDLLTDKELVQWFEQINFFGTPQDENHLRDLKI